MGPLSAKLPCGPLAFLVKEVPKPPEALRVPLPGLGHEARLLKKPHQEGEGENRAYQKAEKQKELYHPFLLTWGLRPRPALSRVSGATGGRPRGSFRMPARARA